tara:strand:- start:1281 stop:3104 length:1824 start_codon:yes stop_codon:yes gene_type:complete
MATAKFRTELDPTPLQKGAKQAEDALGKLGNKAKKTENQVVGTATKSGNAFVKMGQKMDGRTRFIFNNTANQLGDMAVQGSMGTDMFRVMGMQLPQLAGGFALLGGSMGLVMPLLGVLAAIGFPIIAAMRLASGGSLELSERLEDLAEDIQALDKVSKISEYSTSKLQKAFGRFGNEVMQTNKTMLEFRKLVLESGLNTSFDAAVNEFGSTFKQFTDTQLSAFESAQLKINQRYELPAVTEIKKTFDISAEAAKEYLMILRDVNQSEGEDRIAGIKKLKELSTSYGAKQFEDTKKINSETQTYINNLDELYRQLVKIQVLEDRSKTYDTNKIAQSEMSLAEKLGYAEYVATRLAAPDKPVKAKKVSKSAEQTRIDKELQKLKQYAAQIKPIITLTQEYEFATTTLLKAKEKGAITEQEYANKLSIVTDKYQIATGAALDFNKIATSASRDLGNSLMSLAEGTTTVKDAFKSMATNIIKELYRVMVVQQAVRGIMGAFGYSQGSTGGYIPTPVPGAEGGGYTGSGSRSGGVDGRGGFHAILHPQETVIDHTKGQGLGTTVNQTINVSTGVQQTVRTEIIQLMPKIAETTKMAVLDAKRRGGSFSAAFN